MSLSNNFPTVGPVLNLDFLNSEVLDPRITFTRASTATYFNQLGVLQTAQNNIPRFDYNPSTLVAQDLLIEEQRTNSIRNNTMQGAVAGTPGTLPTNWVQSALAAGLTANVLGTGTSSGITYIDIRISGTTADASGWSVFTDASTQIAASSGQVWTGSSYVAIIGGSTANITLGLVRVVERNSGGGYIAESNNSWTAATATLANNRFFAVRTLGGTAAFVQFGVYFQANSGVAIDITLRIGLPQLEQGAFATSVIPTTTTALTRNADVASMTGTNFSSWFNAAAGSLYTEFVINSTAPTSGFPTGTSLNNGTLNNRINAAYLNDSVNLLDMFVSDGGVTQAALSSGTYTAMTVAKMISVYASNDFALCTNGGSVFTDASGTVPTVSRLEIGNQISSNYLNGYIRRITYYNYRVSNAQLQALTGS